MPNLPDSIRNSGVLEIRDRVASISGGRVLDVATQQGGFINTLMLSLKDFESFLGIDISEESLEKAREGFSDDRVGFELMNAEELRFDDESFDTVSMSHSLHHLENVENVLGEMLRVLKPGGHLILLELFSDEDQSEAQRTDILTHHLGARLDRKEGVPHFDTLSRQQIRDYVDGLELSSAEVFETTWGLKCLNCPNVYKCEDPKSEFNMNNGREEIGEVFERAKSLPEADDAREEAELLLERLERTGYQSASVLYFICKK